MKVKSCLIKGSHKEEENDQNIVSIFLYLQQQRSLFESLNTMNPRQQWNCLERWKRWTQIVTQLSLVFVLGCGGWFLSVDIHVTCRWQSYRPQHNMEHWDNQVSAKLWVYFVKQLLLVDIVTWRGSWDPNPGIQQGGGPGLPHPALHQGHYHIHSYHHNPHWDIYPGPRCSFCTAENCSSPGP